MRLVFFLDRSLSESFPARCWARLVRGFVLFRMVGYRFINTFISLCPNLTNSSSHCQRYLCSFISIELIQPLSKLVVTCGHFYKVRARFLLYFLLHLSLVSRLCFVVRLTIPRRQFSSIEHYLWNITPYHA